MCPCFLQECKYNYRVKGIVTQNFPFSTHHCVVSGGQLVYMLELAALMRANMNVAPG